MAGSRISDRPTARTHTCLRRLRTFFDEGPGSRLFRSGEKREKAWIPGQFDMAGRVGGNFEGIRQRRRERPQSFQASPWPSGGATRNEGWITRSVLWSPFSPCRPFLSPHLPLRDRAVPSRIVVSKKGVEPLGFEDLFRLFQFIGPAWGVNRNARAEIPINSRFDIVSPFRSEHQGSDRCRIHDPPPRSRSSCARRSIPSSPGRHTGMYPIRFRRFRDGSPRPTCNLRLHAAPKVPYFGPDRRKCAACPSREAEPAARAARHSGRGPAPGSPPGPIGGRASEAAARLRRSVLRDVNFPGHQGNHPPRPDRPRPTPAARRLRNPGSPCPGVRRPASL